MLLFYVPVVVPGVLWIAKRVFLGRLLAVRRDGILVGHVRDRLYFRLRLRLYSKSFQSQVRGSGDPNRQYTFI